jgi:hypothetical protein
MALVLCNSPAPQLDENFGETGLPVKVDLFVDHILVAGILLNWFEPFDSGGTCDWISNIEASVAYNHGRVIAMEYLVALIDWQFHKNVAQKEIWLWCAHLCTLIDHNIQLRCLLKHLLTRTQIYRKQFIKVKHDSNA